MRQPTLFIPHGGGPCFFMDWNPPDTWDRLRAFLERLPAGLPAPPKALLVISAHWEAPVFTFQTHPAPGLLFDYHGFPPDTYQLTWPAPGAPWLAERAAGLFEAAGIATAFDGQRGFDHGVFVPLKIAFPEASLPCVQMSLKAGLDPEAHLAAGAALAPLRDEEVLIIGSGNSFHNMQVLMAGMYGRSQGVAGREFDAWLKAPPPTRTRKHATGNSPPGIPRPARATPTRARSTCYPCMWWPAPPPASQAARRWKITCWAPWRAPLNMEASYELRITATPR